MAEVDAQVAREDRAEGLDDGLGLIAEAVQRGGDHLLVGPGGLHGLRDLVGAVLAVAVHQRGDLAGRLAERVV